MLINFTNHPSANWSQKQTEAAKKYGKIRDVIFPDVNPNGNEVYINEIATRYATEISALDPDAVLCQGEMTLAFAVAAYLVKSGITVLTACSKREVSENPGANGKTRKHVEFKFVRFRKYC